MVPAVVPLLAIMAVLFSLAYFAMASIPFLFVRLDVPEVWRLFRGLFDTYFRVVMIVGAGACVAFATYNHPIFAAAMLMLGATALVARGRVLEQMDAQFAATRAGDTLAMRRLRTVHWSAMLVNVAVIAGVAGSLTTII